MKQLEQRSSVRGVEGLKEICVHTYTHTHMHKKGYGIKVLSKCIGAIVLFPALVFLTGNYNRLEDRSFTILYNCISSNFSLNYVTDSENNWD